MAFAMEGMGGTKETPPQKKLLDFGKRFTEIAIELAERKNADYAGDEDPFRNLRRGGSFGIAVRMDDKVSRLLTLTHPNSKGARVNESKVDTCLDIINYAWLLIAFEEMERGSKK